MTYDQILHFIAVVEHSGFQAAANALHKTQPSLSVSLKKLEEELGVLLFDRGFYRPKLTQEGKLFYQKALQTAQSFKELTDLGQDFGRGIEPEISLAIDAVTPLKKLGPFLQQFFEKRRTRLNLSVEVLEGSLYKLKNQSAEIAITTRLTQDSEFEFISFSEVTMIPVISKRLLKASSTREDLLAIPQIIVKSSGPPSSLSFGVEEGKSWSVTDHSLKSYLIHNSLGWGRLPLHLVKDSLAGKKLVSLESLGIKPLYFELCLSRLKSRKLGPVATELWQSLSHFQK